MDEPQIAPSVESPVTTPVEQTAPQEQPSPPNPATTDEAPTTDAGLMRAFTQSQQKLSSVAAELGIPKTSTAEQFVAAIKERKRVLAEADAQLDADPRVAAQVAALRAREERIAQQQYGESAALAATLLDAARGATSLLDLAEIVDQAVIERAATRFTSATPAQAGGSPQPQGGPQQPTTGARERNLMAEVPGAVAGAPQGATDKAKDPTDFFRRMFTRA